jgi:hypothetical protein
MSELDKDFEKHLEELNAKLVEAAKLMKEVNDLREKAGLDSLIFSAWMREDAYRNIRNQIEEEENRKPDSNEIYDRIEKLQETYEQIETSGLERELNRAGWSTSSSYC